VHVVKWNLKKAHLHKLCAHTFMAIISSGQLLLENSLMDGKLVVFLVFLINSEAGLEMSAVQLSGTSRFSC